MAEVLRLKLEFAIKHEKWRLAREEAQKAHDAEKALQDAKLSAELAEA